MLAHCAGRTFHPHVVSLIRSLCSIFYDMTLCKGAYSLRRKECRPNLLKDLVCGYRSKDYF